MVKASKTLNPADKARKEARKKELKKNKKQRQQVRSAAIESRNPEQIMEDLEKLDSLEYDISTNPTLCDTLYKDKRKRLKDTWSKILLYYQKEDPEKHIKLKKLETDYENKHKKLVKEFEAIKAAQEVKIEEVFLPPEPDLDIDIADDDPLLSESVYIGPLDESVKPPGCPPGLPPDLRLIADSLRSSLVASIPVESQTLPFDLTNLQIPLPTRTDSARSPNQGQRQRMKKRPSNMAVSEQSSTQQSSKSRNQKETMETPTTDGSATKAAIIESKPVIFNKPKATAFIPASVRSKLAKQEPER